MPLSVPAGSASVKDWAPSVPVKANEVRRLPNGGWGRWNKPDGATEATFDGANWSPVDSPTQKIGTPRGFGDIKNGPYRILQLGSSIAASNVSPNQVFVEHLKTTYGDAGEKNYYGGILGGDFDVAVNGWVKQPYGGLSFTRVRGDTTSTDLRYVEYFDQVIIEFSKESDGGQADVQIDGVTVGTIDSSGAQAYGQQLVLNTTARPHTLTIKKPTTGRVYLERVRCVVANRVGIENLNATLGGSFLAQSYNQIRQPTSGTVVPGVPIVGWAGVDALFDRADIDMVICTYTVNDSGNRADAAMSGFYENYKPAIDRGVAKTKARQTVLVLMSEMAGHYARPGTGSDLVTWQHLQYEKVKDYQQQLARDNAHVVFVDWDSATRIDTDLPLYMAQYYDATGTPDAPVGDFIHPHRKAMNIGATAMCAAMDVQAPTTADGDEVARQRRSAILPLGNTGITTTVDGLVKRYQTARGHALQLGRRDYKVPYYQDETALDVSATSGAAAIAASGTSDQYGKYITWTNAVAGLGSAGVAWVNGDRARVVMVARGTISIRCQPDSTFYVDGVAIPADVVGGNTTFPYDLGPVPVALTVEFGSTIASPFLTMNGVFYEFSVVKAASVPILTHRPWLSGFHQIGPDVLLAGDPDFNADYIGQGYIEDISGVTGGIRKRLRSHGEKWDFATLTTRRVGVYEALDRTLADLRVARQYAGVISAGSDPLLGGGGELTTSGTKAIRFTSVPLIPAAPAAPSATPVGTGGTFAAGTYFWKVTALNANGESLGSTEVTATVVLNDSVTISWTAVTGATGYRIYRGTTAGGESVYYAPAGTGTTYTDTNAASTAGTPPILAGRRTVVVKMGATANAIELSFFNGGNNQRRYIAPDGTLSTTQVYIRTGLQKHGENLVFTFDLPTDTATLAVNTNLDVVVNGATTPVPTATLAKGNSGLI